MPFAADAWIRPNYEYPVETYLADLDRYGISFGVIAAASLYGDYNDYTLWALQTHKRLRATIAPDPAAQLSQLQRLNDQGVVGVRLQLKESAPLPDIAGFDYRKYLRRLADSGMHLELNAGSTHLSQLLPALKDSGVNVVVDHFGLLRSPRPVSRARASRRYARASTTALSGRRSPQVFASSAARRARLLKNCWPGPAPTACSGAAILPFVGEGGGHVLCSGAANSSTSWCRMRSNEGKSPMPRFAFIASKRGP